MSNESVHLTDEQRSYEAHITNNFPLSRGVLFIDGNNVSKTGEVVLAKGIVNGPALSYYGRDADGNAVLVGMIPVWSSREGREPTTIYVEVGNVVA